MRKKVWLGGSVRKSCSVTIVRTADNAPANKAEETKEEEEEEEEDANRASSLRFEFLADVSSR